MIIETITEAALAVGVSPALLLGICFQESSFQNVIVPHDGSSASMGVCQVKLSTSFQFNKSIRPLPTKLMRRISRHRKTILPYTTDNTLMNPAVNARVAAEYVKWLSDRYRGRIHCVAYAYNAGPGRLKPRECNKKFRSKYSRKITKHMEVQTWLQLQKNH